jgi:hypothetical protein
MMMRRTAIVVGPGGIGKSPLDFLFKVDARIDPYRLRSDGPRDSGDVLYAPPRLRDELLSALATLGDQVLQIGRPDWPMEWFPRAKVLFFKVRDDWQCVILNGLEGQTAKAEIYAPILPTLLSTPDISDLLGKTEIILLNPAPQSVTAMQDWKRLEKETRHNCTGRGDSLKSVQDRVRSIAGEASAWKQLIQEYAATEYCAWEFPEYLYKRPPPGVGMVEHQKRTLIQARSRLLEGNPDLGLFFKREDEIAQMDGVLVK